MVAASSFGAVVQLVLVLTSGFTIVRGAIPPWWRWAYWLSPYSYAVRALVINELTAPAWRAPARTPGRTIGEEALLAFDFETGR